MVCWNLSTFPQVVGWAGSGVLLDDVQAPELALEGVASAAAAGEAGRVDHAVVGQGGGRDPVLGCGFAEGGGDDRSGDPGVCGDVQGVAGAVVEPADDLHVVGPGDVDQAVVGEVGLPGLVGHRRLEPDVGGLRVVSWARGRPGPLWPGSG